MSKIVLKNGNVIETIESTVPTIRSNRSKLISFFCYNCMCIHEDYPINDASLFSGVWLCKESLLEE